MRGRVEGQWSRAMSAEIVPTLRGLARVNAGFLSTYQFSLLAEGYDTVVLSSYSQQPLDAAAPIQASWLIGQALAERIRERYTGRVTRWETGSTTQLSICGEGLSALALCSSHPVRYGIVITDRTLTKPVQRLTEADVTWVLFDWWQFLRSAVPQERLVDAYLYLCMASTVYRTNEACASVGWTVDVIDAMGKEGSRLFDVMEEQIVLVLEREWSLIA